MLDILKFIFSSFAIWAGHVVILAIIMTGLVGIAEALAPKRGR